MKTTKVLFYCTKGKPSLLNLLNGTDYRLDCKELWKEYNPNDVSEVLNGKIVAECEVETEEIRLSAYSDYEDTIYLFDTPTLRNYELTQKSYLSDDELGDYLINEKGYALHIKNLKELRTPLTFEKNCIYKAPQGFKQVLKAPQNMMRVYDRFGNMYILISIRPEWLCKILNGEKTIEVRKKVLKEMLPDE